MKILTWFYCLPLYIPIIMTLSAIVIFAFVMKTFNMKVTRVVAFILFIIAIGLILYSTLTNRTIGYHGEHRLIPFYSLYLSKTNNEEIRIIIMNTILFIPFGMVGPFLIKKHPYKITIITGFLFSLVIEIIQLFFKLGIFEIDDVIFNTLGSAIGTLSYLIYDKLNAKKFSQN